MIRNVKTARQVSPALGPGRVNSWKSAARADLQPELVTIGSISGRAGTQRYDNWYASSSVSSEIALDATGLEVFPVCLYGSLLALVHLLADLEAVSEILVPLAVAPVVTSVGGCGTVAVGLDTSFRVLRVPSRLLGVDRHGNEGHEDQQQEGGEEKRASAEPCPCHGSALKSPA